MTLEWPQMALLAAAGAVAGTVNVIAGGGSLLTLPLMVFLGLPATVANGTNRVAILAQNVGAVWGFRRRGVGMGGRFSGAVLPVVAGAAAGTFVATQVGDAAFQRILAAVMVVAALAVVWRPTVGEDPASRPRARRVVLVLAWAAAGFYGGFIQAGIGFILLALAALAGLDLVRGNALKVALVLAFTPISLVLFARAGMVDWTAGLALAAGNAAGSQVGVHISVGKGEVWIRRVVTLMVVLFALRLWSSA